MQSKARGNKSSYWGYSFRWTDLHQLPEDLHKLRYTYDYLADECLQRLNEISSSNENATGQNSDQKDEPQGKTREREMYALLRDHGDSDPKLKPFWTHVNSVPEWVDWDQIERGQAVFYRYGLPILNTVRLRSPTNLSMYGTLTYYSS